MIFASSAKIILSFTSPSQYCQGLETQKLSPRHALAQQCHDGPVGKRPQQLDSKVSIELVNEHMRTKSFPVLPTGSSTRHPKLPCVKADSPAAWEACMSKGYDALQTLAEYSIEALIRLLAPAIFPPLMLRASSRLKNRRHRINS